MLQMFRFDLFKPKNVLPDNSGTNHHGITRSPDGFRRENVSGDESIDVVGDVDLDAFNIVRTREAREQGAGKLPKIPQTAFAFLIIIESGQEIERKTQDYAAARSVNRDRSAHVRAR